MMTIPMRVPVANRTFNIDKNERHVWIFVGKLNTSQELLCLSLTLKIGFHEELANYRPISTTNATHDSVKDPCDHQPQHQQVI